MIRSTPRWRMQLPEFDLAPNVIHLFNFIFTDRFATTGLCQQALTKEETVRAERFVHLIDRNRFVAGRTMLRLVLARLLGQPGSAIKIKLKHGRPYLARDPGYHIDFNISHGGECVVLALVRDAMVGVDVEPRKEFSSMDGVAKRVMSETEYAEYRSRPDSRKIDCFFRLWVRKEAVLKFLGAGFQIDPSSISVGHRQSKTIEVQYLDRILVVSQGTINGVSQTHYWGVASEKEGRLQRICIYPVSGELL